MAIIASGFVQRQEVAHAVERALELLRPDVVLIRYSFGEDWTGDPSIFFRVVLANEAARPERLLEVAQRVAIRLEQEVQPEDLGLHAYFNYRSQAEQEELQGEFSASLRPAPGIVNSGRDHPAEASVANVSR